jgi:molecular chaperone GrpE
MAQDHDDREGETRPPDPQEEEIEILEVVGVQDSPHAASAEPHEILLAFEERAAAAGALAAPSVRGRPGSDEETLLRLRADYDNLRKRVDRERQEFEARANLDLIGRLLPILDGFERALAMGSRPGGHEAFRDGIDLIYRQLTDELRRHGLRPIEALGRPFDPQVHDAVATDVASGEPANTVVEELRRGYLFGDRLLRPAMVRVATGLEADESGSSQEGSGG